MAKRKMIDPSEFTVAQLQQMLAVKTQTEDLVAKRDELAKELATVEKQIESLTSRLTGSRPGRTKAAKKRSVKKASGRRAKKKSSRVAAKGARVTKKKAASKTGRVTVESVVVDLLNKAGEPMAFKDILATIQKKKLVKTKSANFANVLRRTLSTSEIVKRAGRGVYSI